MMSLQNIWIRLIFAGAVVLAIGGCTTTNAPAAAAAAAAPQSTTIVTETNVQTSTGRDIYVRWLAPKENCACPLVIFSHGAFSTTTAYDHLLAPIAAAGYRIAIPRHADSSAYAGTKPVSPDEYTRLRIEDNARILVNSATWPEAEKPASWIAAGHSFGAMIAQYFGGAKLSGQPVSGARGPSKVLALSPPGALPASPNDYSTMRTPMLLVTGTTDIVDMFAPRWEDHLLSHETAPEGLSTALVFKDADHYFNGLYGRTVDRPRTKMDDALIKSVIAFIQGKKTPDSARPFLVDAEQEATQ